MGALHPIINPREPETKKTIAAPWVCWLLTFPIAGPICCCEWPRTGVSAGHGKPCPTGARYIEALIYGMPRCDAPLLAVGDSASGRRLQLWLRPQPALLPWTCRRLVVVHVVILTGRSPLGDRGRQSMRCAPHLASSTPSVPRRARDGTGTGQVGGSGWLGCLRTYRPAVVLSECKATCPIMVSVNMLLLDFQHRSGIFARTHEIPLFSWPRDIGEFK